MQNFYLKNMPDKETSATKSDNERKNIQISALSGDYTYICFYFSFLLLSVVMVVTVLKTF